MRCSRCSRSRCGRRASACRSRGVWRAPSPPSASPPRVTSSTRLRSAWRTRAARSRPSPSPARAASPGASSTATASRSAVRTARSCRAARRAASTDDVVSDPGVARGVARARRRGGVGRVRRRPRGGRRGRLRRSCRRAALRDRRDRRAPPAGRGPAATPAPVARRDPRHVPGVRRRLVGRLRRRSPHRALHPRDPRPCERRRARLDRRRPRRSCSRPTAAAASGSPRCSWPRSRPTPLAWTAGAHRSDVL